MTTLKRLVLVPYPSLTILANVVVRRKLWMICNVYTLAKFVPVRCSDQQLEREESKEYEKLFVYVFIFYMTASL